ncbi:MAG TPA: hypothetical protein VEG34_02480 [Thermoanaerobaculia bacterium]|nr:hypothetical protein [Thermoanaerobaculia bacterium]
MVPNTRAAGGDPERAAPPEPPAGAEVLERALRGLGVWVRVAQAGLAAVALLAFYGGFRGLSGAQGSPATLQVGALAVLACGTALIALTLCGLLGPVARVLGARRPAAARPAAGAPHPEARLEAVLVQHRAFWRQAGQWSVVLLVLAAAAAGVVRFAGPAAAAEAPPLFEDLDRGCDDVPEGALCFALARYAGGRLQALSDWQTLPVVEHELMPLNGGHRLSLRAKAPEGVEWEFSFLGTDADRLREGPFLAAADNRGAISISTPISFFPSLPPGLELARLRGIPPHPRTTWEECPRVAGRLQVHRLDLPLDGILRAVQADFERACLDGGGAWVAVGRFSYRHPTLGAAGGGR